MKVKRYKLFAFAMLFLSFILMTACTEAVTVDTPQKHPLVVGQKCAMKGYVESWFGDSYVDHWESENPDVATIGYYTGLVEALKPGNSVISAFGKRNSDGFELHVTDTGYLSQIDLNDTIIIHQQEYATVDFRSSNSIHYQIDNPIAGIVATNSTSMFYYTGSLSINGVNHCPINDGSVSEFVNSIILVGNSIGFTQLHIYNESVNIDEYVPLMVVQE